MANLEAPMTKQDFILSLPFILIEVVEACSSPRFEGLTTSERLIEIANRLLDVGEGLGREDKQLVERLACQLIATEPAM